MERRHSFQTIAWFNDLRQRSRLDLEPPYQRRSVWNQSFKDYFVETVLLNYPAPAIFLYEEMSPQGLSVSHVVDGKQRLTTLFEFVDGVFPVGEKCPVAALQGKFFSALSDDAKRAFWSYQFLVEYIPKDDEKLIDNIFERINRNVAKLTAQELRHAKYDGEFIRTAESLAEWMASQLPPNVPRVGVQSRKQMKDVELVALLLLLEERGAGSYSATELDTVFASLDESWDRKEKSEEEFRAVVAALRGLFLIPQLASSRLRNQADFYSLFGAVLAATREGRLPPSAEMIDRLIRFVESVDDDTKRAGVKELQEYYDAARSASSDKSPRETRIRLVLRVLTGEMEL